MPERTYLITPGPTPVPPEVAAAMARPLIHHRSPDFKVLLEQTLAQLRRAFATEQEVLLFAGSGTSAMESAVANLPLDQGFAGTKIDLGGFNYLATFNIRF